ncbi:MAG: hypothetical protein GYB64_06245, partial [Chloroflexi bacterium]|nr:hypothetical protein [Chloroflexota bacterium]
MRRFLLLCLLILVGCRADGPNPTEEPPTLPPDTPTTLAGVVSPLFASDSVGGRALALCVVESRLARFPLACEPTGLRTTTAPDGSFRFQNIPPARYAVLVDSGLGDFSAALDTWRGAILRPGDWEWVQQTYLGLAPAESTHLNLPGSFPVPLDQAGYAVDTLSLGDSPFIVAHRVAAEDGTVLVHPIVADLTRTRLVEISFPVGTPEPLDRAAIREAVGPLTREDLRWVDPQVADRWTRFTNGDDTAFRDTDARLIAALRTGAIHPIGGTTFTTVEQGGGRLLKWMAYRVVDVDSGEEQIVGHVDPITGDVIEAVSGYRLNVLDPPGEWITPGPNGEQIYHYGFSYYRRWERILPDPVIAMVERFYTQGASHVRRWSDLYQTADATFGGDLSLVAWDTTLPNRIAGFNPSTLTPPTLYLPDSGTVDVDRGRFLQAMIDGQVTVDRDSVMAFYNSDFARENPYIETLDPQDVIDA